MAEAAALRPQLENPPAEEISASVTELHLSDILDVATEAIISSNATGQIIRFNQGAEHIFGYDRTEIIGQPLAMLLPEQFRAQHAVHMAAFAAAPETARLMNERQEIVGRRRDGTEFPAEASISKLTTSTGQIFTVVLRDVTERKRVLAERELLINGLRALDEAAQAIASELSIEQVLQRIAHAARDLIKVRHAALGIHDGQGNLTRFITAGVSPAQRAEIGPLPIGRGLLGLLLHEGQSLIVADISRHPSAAGMPEHHPPMKSLLGVPVYSKKRLIGALYLADKENGEPFSASDQRLVEMLAQHAAIAIDNAYLYEENQRLAILEERERFAQDLHDGIIQSIYGVGLALDTAKAMIAPEAEPVRRQIDLGLKNLAEVITDVRNYIFDLRPQALANKGLRARLEHLIKELQTNTNMTIEVEIAADIDTYLDLSQAGHLFHITHEALANVARHAKAQHVRVSLAHADRLIRLQVEDDGLGFAVPTAIKPGHHGLANVQARVSQLGATLQLESVPRQGTQLVVVLPVKQRSLQ